MTVTKGRDVSLSGIFQKRVTFPPALPLFLSLFSRRERQKQRASFCALCDLPLSLSSSFCSCTRQECLYLRVLHCTREVRVRTVVRLMPVFCHPPAVDFLIWELRSVRNALMYFVKDYFRSDCLLVITYCLPIKICRENETE